MLFALGLLFGAGGTAAQVRCGGVGSVVNCVFDINDPGIGVDAVFPYDAILFAEDCGRSPCGPLVDIFCGNWAGDFVELIFDSPHTDSSKISASKAKLAQKAKGNQAFAIVIGGGTLAFAVPVICEQNKLTGDVSTKKMDGKAKVQAKNCTGLLGPEADYIDAICGTDLKALKIKRDSANWKSVKVKAPFSPPSRTHGPVFPPLTLPPEIGPARM
jgi:hypothetical protein